MQSHFLAHHCRELGLILNRAWLCVPNSIFTCYFYLLYFYFFRGGGSLHRTSEYYWQRGVPLQSYGGTRRTV